MDDKFNRFDLVYGTQFIQEHFHAILFDESVKDYLLCSKNTIKEIGIINFILLHLTRMWKITKIAWGLRWNNQKQDS